MNIGIDARLLIKNPTGIGIYLYEIIKCLNKLDNINKYYLYSNKDIELDIKLNKNWVRKVFDSYHIGTLWMYYILPKQLKRDKIDIFWGTSHLLPHYNPNIRYVLTIHDLALFKFNGIGSNYNTIIQKLVVKNSCINADKIIAVSKSTKKDIVKILKIRSSKIKVIYPGIPNEDMLKKINIEKLNSQKIIKNKLNIKGDYILYLGTIEPRKNVNLLIKAYEECKHRYNINCCLVLAGGLGWKYNNTLQLIDKSKYKESIILTGYISNEDKYHLYKCAKMLVYPSIYEGFGIPILEAFSMELPVITSYVSSLPEVGGTAAKYIYDIKDYKELSNKIQDVLSLSNENRKEIVSLGLIQSRKFNYRNCALEILNVFKNLYDK